MQGLRFLNFLACVLLPVTQLAPSVQAGTVTADFAFQGMLANIGGASNPSLVPNVLTGAVIASPSTASPNYFYSWVRDSAMTMKIVIDNFIHGQHGVKRSLIENWINAELIHQSNAMPSSSSLGEPKFNVDGSLFTGPWGRPQNDGPALRATAVMKYAYQIGLSDSLVTSKLYKSDLSQPSLIKSDLEYVAHHWQDSTFDLWEEVQATHFFTLAVQYRALTEGAAFATAMKDSGAATFYAQQASAISSKLQSFWSSSLNRVQAYQNTPSGFNRNGLDCSVLLGSLHGWIQNSTASGVSSALFGPGSDRILATHRQYVDSFRGLYPINNNAAAPAAVGVGRYPSDIYDGVSTSQGNPWFLCTTTAAEILYNAQNLFASQGGLTVSSTNQNFFSQFQSGVSTGSYGAGSKTYSTLVQGMKNQADGFMSIVNQHAAANGSLAEEFSRYNGYEVGARDLTWSYAAFLSADAARSGRAVF
ncbi:hypothetical protein OC846_001300 [Tilletia horrida]|uniref:glucan 1,4-alpha-glucosidase n=1 Tax=Tilletia horrida TaxID=155126 RepID=A0AAN6GVI5_9BASI|nr:hypothetical protein OC845_001246 [Tilletia horrida]KAK0556206.1 hypothetical protein OC846_001300 [Tilletia horrida]KAK0569131.1 hypothetical protein OC861_001271 [Tilletia horrida]